MMICTNYIVLYDAAYCLYFHRCQKKPIWRYHRGIAIGELHANMDKTLNTPIWLNRSIYHHVQLGITMACQYGYI